MLQREEIKLLQFLLKQTLATLGLWERDGKPWRNTNVTKMGIGSLYQVPGRIGSPS
jgi:hypothetical protein